MTAVAGFETEIYVSADGAANSWKKLAITGDPGLTIDNTLIDVTNLRDNNDGTMQDIYGMFTWSVNPAEVIYETGDDALNIVKTAQSITDPTQRKKIYVRILPLTADRTHGFQGLVSIENFNLSYPKGDKSNVTFSFKGQNKITAVADI